MILEFNGIPIEVTKKAIKNFNVRIYPPDGMVKVSAPLRYSDRLILKTLEQKKDWIHEQRERMRNTPVKTAPQMETGAAIPFMGKNYLLIVEEHNGPSQIRIQDQLMHCYVRPGSTEAQKQAVLDAWYKQQMIRIVPDLMAHWEQIVGVKVNDWNIKKMKSRWGSCAIQKARICLNLHLIKKTQICLEYVLVHELVHLWEASHNQRFYQLMSQFMPEWRKYQHLLEGKEY